MKAFQRQISQQMDPPQIFQAVKISFARTSSSQRCLAAAIALVLRQKAGCPSSSLLQFLDSTNMLHFVRSQQIGSWKFLIVVGAQLIKNNQRIGSAQQTRWPVPLQIFVVGFKPRGSDYRFPPLVCKSRIDYTSSTGLPILRPEPFELGLWLAERWNLSTSFSTPRIMVQSGTDCTKRFCALLSSVFLTKLRIWFPAIVRVLVLNLVLVFSCPSYGLKTFSKYEFHHLINQFGVLNLFFF